MMSLACQTDDPCIDTRSSTVHYRVHLSPASCAPGLRIPLCNRGGRANTIFIGHQMPLKLPSSAMEKDKCGQITTQPAHAPAFA